MKKAFTLLELMITIAVLAILMGLVVRLGAADELERRENAVQERARITVQKG